MSEPRIGSLCSGAGMLDEAVRTVLGGQVVWHCETDPAASRVLDYHYPGVPNLGDLTAVDWAAVEPVDVATAGYPCQPDSLAGKGLSEDDHRWIWPDIAHALSVLRPRLVVLENVPGHFVRGFRTVLGSLATLGFDAEWTLVRASDIGAPHRRERLFVAAWSADSNGSRLQGGEPARRCDMPARRPAPDAGGIGRERLPGVIGGGWDSAVGGEARGHAGDGASPSVARGVGNGDDVQPRSGTDGLEQAAGRGTATAADTDGDGRESLRRIDALGRDTDRRGGADVAWGIYEPAVRRWERTLGRVAPPPTETGPKSGRRLSPRFTEWMLGWPDGWVTDVPGVSRNDALRICGNGVVPQQASEALRRLLSADCEAVA